MQTAQEPRYYHSTGNGRVFGPSKAGETLPAYRDRVRVAYGDLRGVTVGKREDFHPSAFALG